MVLNLLYDLKYNPLTYDFFVPLVAASTYGPVNVVFISAGTKSGFKSGHKCAEGQEQKRFDNILVKGCQLANATYIDHVKRPITREEAKRRYPKRFEHDFEYQRKGKRSRMNMCHYPTALSVYQKEGRIFKLHSPIKTESREYVTITIRKQPRNMERNSNVEEWMQFKKHLEQWHKVILIWDSEDKQQIGHKEAANNILVRMSLYEGAKMNYFVPNGPAALCWYSDAPYMTFKMNKCDQEHMKKIKMSPGSQIAWANENQKLIWEDDTFENMKKHLLKT